MTRITAGHWLALSLALVVPVAVFAPKGEVIVLALCALPLLARAYAGGYLRDLWRTPLTAILAALLTWSAVSATWAIEPAMSFRSVLSHAGLALAALVAIGTVPALTEHERRVARRALVAGVMAGGALLAFEAALDLPIGTLLRQPEKPLAPSLLNSALGTISMLVWPTALILSQDGRRRAAGLLIVAAAGVLLAGSGLSARVAFALGGVSAAVLWVGRRRALAALSAICVVGVLAAPVLPRTVLAPDLWAGRMPTEMKSGLHRLHIWQFAAARIAERPWLGWGLDSSRALPGRNEIVIENGRALQLHPHNAPLQVRLELGLPGALGLAAVVALAFAAARHLPRAAAAAAGATTVAGLTVASLSYGIWQHWWLATLALVSVATMLAIADAEPDP
jgi:exopolysaccharide production protein ExoQ